MRTLFFIINISSNNDDENKKTRKKLSLYMRLTRTISQIKQSVHQKLRKQKISPISLKETIGTVERVFKSERTRKLFARELFANDVLNFHDDDDDDEENDDDDDDDDDDDAECDDDNRSQLFEEWVNAEDDEEAALRQAVVRVLVVTFEKKKNKKKQKNELFVINEREFFDTFAKEMCEELSGLKFRVSKWEAFGMRLKQVGVIGTVLSSILKIFTWTS